MTNSETGSNVQHSYSSVALVSVSACMLLRCSTCGQVRASTSLLVPVQIRTRVQFTSLAPSFTHIPRPESGAPAFSLLHKNPVSHIPSFSRLSSPSFIFMTAPTFSAQPAQQTFSFKRPYFPEYYAHSKRTCLEWRQPFHTVAWKITPNLRSISVLRQHGRIPTSGPLPRLLDPVAWKWLSGWEHFHGSLRESFNEESFLMAAVNVLSSLWPHSIGKIDVSDRTQLVVQSTQSGEDIPLVSVFEFDCFFSKCLDGRRFILGMSNCVVDFYVCDGHGLRLTAADSCASRWLHYGCRGTTWCCCHSGQTSIFFVRSEKVVNYENRLSVMLGRFRRQFCSGDFLQGLTSLSVQLCCLDRSRYSLWYHCRRSFLKNALRVEHRVPKLTTFIYVFAQWHNAQVFSIRPQHCGRFFVLAGSRDWVLCPANLLLLIPSPPNFACYSGVSLDWGYIHLIDVLAPFKLTVLAVVSLLHAASGRLLEISNRNSPDDPCVSYFVAMSSPVIFLVKTAGVCAILDGSGYDIATAIVAWEVMRSVEWLVLTPEHVAQLLLFTMRFRTVSDYTIEGSTRIVQERNESFLTQYLLQTVSHLGNWPLWAPVRRTVAKYFHRTYEQPLPSSSLNGPIFELSTHTSQDPRGDSSVYLPSTGCPAGKHLDVERVPTTKTSVASPPHLAESTTSLHKDPIGPLSSVLLDFLFFLVPIQGLQNLLGPRVSFFFAVASPLKVSSVPASCIFLDIYSAVNPQGASESAKLSLSGAAQMGPPNAETASPSRWLTSIFMRTSRSPRCRVC